MQRPGHGGEGKQRVNGKRTYMMTLFATLDLTVSEVHLLLVFSLLHRPIYSIFCLPKFGLAILSLETENFRPIHTCDLVTLTLVMCPSLGALLIWFPGGGINRSHGHTEAWRWRRMGYFD